MRTSASLVRASITALLLGILLLAIPHDDVLAQAPPLDPETSGTAYLIAFPDTVSNILDEGYPNTRVNPEFSIWIYSAVGNRVKVISGGATTMIDVPAGEFTVHSFTGSPVVAEINTISSNTYRIEAESPIILYCYLATIQGLEAWTPIPIDRWGKEYHSANAPGEIVRDIGRAQATLIPHIPKAGPAEILILAAYDNTHITLRPPAGMDFLGGPDRAITLNAGQAIQVQSMVDKDAEEETIQPDIAATVIKADKPIGVLSGNTRAKANYTETGLKNNVYKNMLMEWLAPSEQHGTEFVFMPTWDSLHIGSGVENARTREYVRIYSTQGKETPGEGLYPNDPSGIPFTIGIDTLRQFALDRPTAARFRTEIPSQAMMHPSAIVKFNGALPCFGGVPCLSYDAWAPYMVELVPREQWSTFAPYYAPPNPANMHHYLNVVADTAAARNIYREDGTPFPFTMNIPGTDLIWGSIPVQPGQGHYLEGRNGARFFAVAYGLFKGFEEYRPVERAEFEEYNSLAYGYPLAPRRSALSPVQGVDEAARMPQPRLDASFPAMGDESVRIRYGVDKREYVRIDIHDALGKQVRMLVNGNVAAGEYVVEWDASGYASGVYYCRMSVGAWSRTVPVIVRR